MHNGWIVTGVAFVLGHYVSTLTGIWSWNYWSNWLPCVPFFLYSNDFQTSLTHRPGCGSSKVILNFYPTGPSERFTTKTVLHCLPFKFTSPQLLEKDVEKLYSRGGGSGTRDEARSQNCHWNFNIVQNESIRDLCLKSTFGYDPELKLCCLLLYEKRFFIVLEPGFACPVWWPFLWLCARSLKRCWLRSLDKTMERGGRKGRRDRQLNDNRQTGTRPTDLSPQLLD